MIVLACVALCSLSSVPQGAVKGHEPARLGLPVCLGVIEFRWTEALHPVYRENILTESFR